MKSGSSALGTNYRQQRKQLHRYIHDCKYGNIPLRASRVDTEDMCIFVINFTINSADANDYNDTLHFMYGRRS